MPIIQAGKQFTAKELQEMAGNIASMIRDHVQSANDFAGQLASWPDADLIDLGLEQAQINAIKGFYIGDVPAITNALAASQWIRQLVGLGV